MASCLTKIWGCPSNSYSLESHRHNIDSANPFTWGFGCNTNYVGCPESKDTNTIKFFSKYLLTKSSEKNLTYTCSYFSIF